MARNGIRAREFEWDSDFKKLLGQQKGGELVYALASGFRGS
jgi:hypothetical protein